MSSTDTSQTELDRYCPPELREGVRQLAPVLYRDLRKVAHRVRAKLWSPDTFQTTALIHEAYLKLDRGSEFESQTHFLRVAAVTMRHLLINRIEMQRADKRGGELVRVPLEDVEDFVVQDEDTVLTIHEALTRLAAFAPRLAQVVECRYFAGYSEAEIATALGVTERTVRRDWVTARAWLARELGESLGNAALPGTAG